MFTESYLRGMSYPADESVATLTVTPAPLGAARSRVSTVSSRRRNQVDWPTDASQVTDVMWGALSDEDRKKLVNALHYTYHPQDYFQGKSLGAGAFGETRLIADRRSGKKFVLKSLAKNKTDEAALLNEVKILQHLQDVCDGHLLCIEGYQAAGPTRNEHQIVTQVVPGITLTDYITETPDEIRWRNAQDVLRNLSIDMQIMHASGQVAHRDIKPSNLMINPKSLNTWIIDFGLACLRSECPSAGVAGSPLYMAPEIQFEGTPKVPLNFESYRQTDFWALGVTMLEYILGNERFNYLIDVKGLLPQDLLPHLPEEFVNAYPRVVEEIKVLLDLNPNKRGQIFS